MPLFRCDTCGCVENTALGYYWNEKRKGEPVQCSECKDGTWHGEFPKRSADGMLIDQDGHLWSKEEVVRGALPKHYQIVGEVTPNARSEARPVGASRSTDGLVGS